MLIPVNGVEPRYIPPPSDILYELVVSFWVIGLNPGFAFLTAVSDNFMSSPYWGHQKYKGGTSAEIMPPIAARFNEIK